MKLTPFHCYPALVLAVPNQKAKKSNPDDQAALPAILSFNALLPLFLRGQQCIMDHFEIPKAIRITPHDF